MYNVTYVEALQDALLASIEDWPWIDCGPCAVRAACGDPNAPLNLDANLLMNYAFSALFAGNNRRVMTLNRLPGRFVCPLDSASWNNLTYTLTVSLMKAFYCYDSYEFSNRCPYLQTA